MKLDASDDASAAQRSQSMTAPAGGQGHGQTLGSGPAWVASGIALTYLAMQLLWWPATPKIDVPGLVAQAILCLIPLAGLFVVQHLRQSPRLYWPLMAGLSCLLLSHLTDALDEVRVQPDIAGLLIEDGLAVLGSALLVLGLVRWMRFNQQLLAEIQALNADLEQRVTARTARLEGEIAERQQAEARLRDNERRYRELNAMLEQRIVERTAALEAANALLREREAHLQASHQRLTTILNAIDAQVYLADMDTHELLFMNQTLLEAFGPAEGRPCYRVLQGLDAPCPFCTNDKLVNADGSPAGVHAWEFQNQFNHRWYDLRDCAVRWTDGRLVRMEIATDITERKQMELRLRQSEERFRLAFENANTGMCLVDLQGRLLQVNDKMCAIFGLSRQELEGMSVNDLADPEDLTISPTYMAKAIQGLDDSITFEKRYRHRDGHPIHGQVASSLVRDHQGQPLYFVSQVQDVTARRLAEAQLRASEERFRLVVEHAVDNIWTMGPDRRMRFLSPSIQTLVGYSMEEYSELTLEQILMPDSLRVAAAYFTALDVRRAAGLDIAGFPFRGELELRAKDGTGVWTEIIATPLVDAEGRLTELTGVTRDIRERKRFEDAIRTSEQRFRLLLDNVSQIAVQGYTPEGTITFWNQANEQIYGYTAAEALGQDLVELIVPPEQRSKIRGIIHQMASTGVRPPPAELSLMRKDGAPVAVYANYAIIEVPGIGRELYCIDIDLTGLRQAEEQLRLSEERHRLLADHAMDVIWTMNLDGTFNYLSPSIMGLRGYTPEELRHMPLEATFTPASWAIVQAGLARARANLQAGLPVDFRAELEELRKDGSIVWTDVRATGIYDSDGRFIELVGVTRDISERKQYERELEAARRTAEAATRARSQFLANMSHEVRTPMNGVLGLAQLLEREPLTPDQLAMVRRIRASGRTLIGILNDILDLSKIEAGQLRIERHPFALAPTLEQLDGLLGDTARGKGLALRFAVPAGLAGGLVGDDLRLGQVLLNLMGNAIKFTASGEVKVQVEPVAMTATEVRLRFEVRDSGVGIAPEVLPTLFTPFTQADGSITRRFGGTGLGLSISRRLVELMGGTIGAESTPGQGSCFWFELPFARTTDLATPVTPGATDPTATGPRLTGRRLLVVDDSDINREVVARILQREGAEALLADDGQQALDALRAHPTAFDAVLMDVQMPVMDGLTATRRVREELGLTALPVIAFTAGVLPEEQQRAHDAGVTDFLPKPLDLEQLVAVVRRWVPPGPLGDTQPVAGAGSPHPATGPATEVRTGATLDLPVIPGLDTARLAALAQGEASVVRRLLRGLVADLTGADQQVQSDLDQGATTQALELLHRLRGAAANLGAVDLAHSARALEAAIQAGSPDAAERLVQFKACLAALLSAVASALAEPAPPPAPPVVTAAPAAPLDEAKLAELRAALAAHKPRPARRLFAELEVGLVQVYGPPAVQTLTRALDTLRFDEALQVLEGGD